MPHTTRPTRRALLASALLASLPVGARAQGGNDPIRFGILPIGGTVDSSDVWGPLLLELSKAVALPITKTSVTSYDSMEQAIRRDEIDMAFLPGKMALDAVSRHQMQVLAQVVRHDGLPGYRATLLTRKDGPVRNLDAALATPEQWRLARGEKRSLSGFIVPKLELFLPRGIDIETRFRGEVVGTHQRTALALANNEADLATNNTADFERFALQFPVEASRLKVIWQSALVPHGMIVVRGSYPAALRQTMQRFLVAYGRGKGPGAERQREVLRKLHDFAGFLQAGNRSLVPVADLTRKLDLDSAQSAQWINEAARQNRLKRIESDYAAQLRALQAE